LLAQIETPELDAQLRQARADLDTAQANARLAGITAQRTENLMKSQSVLIRERDNAAGASSATRRSLRHDRPKSGGWRRCNPMKTSMLHLTAMSPHATPMSAT
jgi:multidrug resistance efflux pump